VAKSVQQQGGGGPSMQQQQEGAPSGGQSSGVVQRSDASGLYDVMELILDRGLVIDVFLRVSLVGIEVLTVDARVVVASVDTYLRFAEAVSRLDISEESQGVPEMIEASGGGDDSKQEIKGMIEDAKEEVLEEIDEPEREPARSRSRGGDDEDES
jgi:hypothetical protein